MVKWQGRQQSSNIEDRRGQRRETVGPCGPALTGSVDRTRSIGARFEFDPPATQAREPQQPHSCASVR